MKSFRDVIKVILLLFAALCITNTVIMAVFFHINAINPVNKNIVRLPQKQAGIGALPVERDDSGSGVDENTLSGIDAEADEAAQALQQGAQNESPGTASPNAYYMTLAEISYLEDLSLSDKLTALSIMTKIGKEFSDRIYDMAQDGVTFAEMSEIKSLLESCLSRQDVDTLSGILDKSKKLYADQKSMNN